MRALRRFAACAVLLGSLAAGTLAGQPPSVISPIGDRLAAPVTFLWAEPPHPPGVVITYELEISDRPSIDERPLFSAQTTQTQFNFLNRPSEFGFTANVPSGQALSAGTYYWHVRSLAPASSVFTPATAFTLLPEAGTAVSDVAIGAVRAGPAQVGKAVPIAVTVENRGGDDQRNIAVGIVVDGKRIGTSRIALLAPRGRTTIVSSWIPDRAGNVVVAGVLLRGADDNATNDQQTAKVLVADAAAPVTVTVVGRPIERENTLLLVSADGHMLARLDISGDDRRALAASGTLVRITGALSVRDGAFVLRVDAIAPVTPKP